MKQFLSGNGILVPVLYPIGVVVGLGVAGFAGGVVTGSPDGTVAGALAGTGAGGALTMWLYAATLGKTRRNVVIDQALRRSVLVEKSQSFLFMSPHAWAVIATVIATMTVAAGAVIWYGGGAGGALLHKSEKYLADAGGNVAYGNPREGESIAMVFSTVLAGLRNPAARGQFNIEAPDGRQPVRVFCHISTHGNVFIALVPDLQKFSAEEKSKLKAMAWAAAQAAAEHETPAPERLAVAVRDPFLYDEMLIGILAPNHVGGDAGIEERHGPYATRMLYPFFAAPLLAPELSVPPPIPMQPLATTPSAPPPRVSPPPATPTVIVPMASGTVSLGLPTPVSDWRSADGRSIRASLVRFTDAAGTVAEFKREDGASFTIPVEKFAPGDRAELQRIFNATKGDVGS